MKTLFLLRHAKSSWKQPELNDHDRPLNKRGKREAPLVGKYLKEHDLIPDLILSSTARRARDTAQATAEESGYTGEIEYNKDLYLSDTACYLDILQYLPDSVNRVLVVGHNPDMDDFLTLLTDVNEHMTTAALVQVDLPISSWHELNEATDGRLKTFWAPSVK
jgi:phosphohistidine phosphatase